MRLIFIMICLLSSVMLAEGKKGKAGDDFRKAGMVYEAKATKSLEMGDADRAKILFRLAAIKKNAGALADEGRWDEISWDEYHALNKKLHETKGSNKNKFAKKKSKIKVQ